MEADRVLADLRRTAAPVVRKLMSAQRANAIKVKKDKVIKELKGKLTILTKEVLVATPSNCMAMANCLNDDLKAVKVLLDQMEELTEQIGETDLDVY